MKIFHACDFVPINIDTQEGSCGSKWDLQITIQKLYSYII